MKLVDLIVNRGEVAYVREGSPRVRLWQHGIGLWAEGLVWSKVWPDISKPN
jgi:hypothetical protein